MTTDIDEAGGVDVLVDHCGVRLSGGQVQRLALVRALATESELPLADDISSTLDAAIRLSPQRRCRLWRAVT